ncbi:hypothetical protein EVAR_28451_1 [Eumeta japonica]|uniref:Uncharacterized protein n=1 Tax=Eumeta variegata TaxID=151549 RepID=A0A4C1V8V6_EUMVA|nr:hypothetical protein EVAR_28451_1 [Eumeta japonica]
MTVGLQGKRGQLQAAARDRRRRRGFNVRHLRSPGREADIRSGFLGKNPFVTPRLEERLKPSFPHGVTASALDPLPASVKSLNNIEEKRACKPQDSRWSFLFMDACKVGGGTSVLLAAWVEI